MVQIVVHKLVPKTKQKKLRPEKKGTVVWPMEAAQNWRECYDRKKKRTVSGRLCFSAGSNHNRKKLRPEKRYSRVFRPAIFSGGFKLQPEKITTRKIKGTVFWPEEVAQIWQERYDRKKNVQSSGWLCFSAGSNYNRKKLRSKKKWYSRLAVSWKLEKITSGKKGTVVWLLVGGQNTKHNTHHRHNNQQDVW